MRITNKKRRTPWKKKTYSTAQAQSNAEAQRAGARAEHLIERGALQYTLEEQALIRKRHEPYRRVGKMSKGGVFRAVNTGSSGCDYEFYLSDGRAGILECKSRKGKRINLNAVGAHQADELEKLWTWGFLSFVIVYLDNSWYLISWGAFHHPSKRSLNIEDMKTRGILLDVDEEGSPLWVERIEDALDLEDQYLESLED